MQIDSAQTEKQTLIYKSGRIPRKLQNIIFGHCINLDVIKKKLFSPLMSKVARPMWWEVTVTRSPSPMLHLWLAGRQRHHGLGDMHVWKHLCEAGFLVGRLGGC